MSEEKTINDKRYGVGGQLSHFMLVGVLLEIDNLNISEVEKEELKKELKECIKEVKDD